METKLKLTPEQQILFEKAIQDSYNDGTNDATFISNGMYQLVGNFKKTLQNIRERYIESDEN